MGRRVGSKNGFIQCKDCKETSPADEYGEKRRWGICPKCGANQIANRYKYEAARKSHLQKRYGMTPEDYEAMRTKQQGRCAICGQERYLMIDHDHETDKVRGLLCFNCNAGIGQLRDDVTNVLRAFEYLAGNQ